MKLRISNYARAGSEDEAQSARSAEGWLRIGMGVALNAVLWPTTQAMARWSSYGGDAELDLINIGIAMTAMVMLVPLFWRGKSAQVPIAFVLLWLPGLSLIYILASLSKF